MIITKNTLAIAGMGIALIGSAIAAFGAFLGRSEIEKVGGTYWGENPHLKRALQRQANCTLGGFSMVALGSILQIFSTLMA